jgi:hypothetical protein
MSTMGLDCSLLPANVYETLVERAEWRVQRIDRLRADNAGNEQSA